MGWFTCFLIGAGISALTGYLYGRSLLKRADHASGMKIVPSCNDSVRQSEIIAKAIKERVYILGCRNLSWEEGSGKNSYTSHLFDYNERIGNNGAKTKAFLKGDSTEFIKFIRWCHAHGCSIVLRQIGQKTDVTEGKGEVIHLSMPDIKEYKK